MAEVYRLAAMVLAPHDPKTAKEFLTKFIDALFPDSKVSQEKTLEQKMAQLREFSEKEVALIPGKWGLQLSLKEKEPGK